jgi:hypothetical protein
MKAWVLGIKKVKMIQVQWFILVILATLEMKIWRIGAQGQPRQSISHV